MPVRRHAKFLAIATAVALTSFLAGMGESTASATTPEHLKVGWIGGVSTMTLPSSDNFDDTAQLDITSNRAGTAQLSVKRLSGHGGSAYLGGSFVLSGSGTNWSNMPTYNDGDVSAGSWQLTVKLNGATEKTNLKIGSGIAKTVKVTTTPSAVFVNSSQPNHDLTTHIVAKDELGTSLPITDGILGFTDSHNANSVADELASSSPTTPGVDAPEISVLGDNPGAANIKVSDIQGPSAGPNPPSVTVHPKLSVALLTSISITPSFTTFYPNAPTLEDTDEITVDVKNNAGTALPLVSSTVTIHSPTWGTAETWDLPATGPDTNGWNGYNGPSIDYATWDVTVVATLANGNTITKTTTLKISKTVPVKRSVTETYSASSIPRKGIGGTAKCSTSGSALNCVSSASEGKSIYVAHAVPKPVLALADQLDYQVTVALHVTKYSSSGGTATDIWGGKDTGYIDTQTIAETGTITQGPDYAQNGDITLELSMYLSGAVSLGLSKYTITYTYWALPSK